VPARSWRTSATEHGQEHEAEATGLLARCFQHEHDHLQGTLYVNRLVLTVPPQPPKLEPRVPARSWRTSATVRA
jgi:hypothetical protein